MVKLKENIRCYAHPLQREILVGLSDNETIGNSYFLTGGTALSVFYLHHRTSIDLDLFTIKKTPMEDIYHWITRRWGSESKRIHFNDFILQMVIKGVKIDIVYDPISFDEERERYQFSENKSITVDSLKNITSNKLSAMVSRREVKDFLDFFFINKMIAGMDFDCIYKDAQKKEGMFDDSPMVAYHLENNLNIIKQNPFSFPDLLVDFDLDEFYRFYEGLVYQIYGRISKASEAKGFKQT